VDDLALNFDINVQNFSCSNLLHETEREKNYLSFKILRDPSDIMKHCFWANSSPSYIPFFIPYGHYNQKDDDLNLTRI